MFGVYSKVGPIIRYGMSNVKFFSTQEGKDLVHVTVKFAFTLPKGEFPNYFIKIMNAAVPGMLGRVMQDPYKDPDDITMKFVESKVTYMGDIPPDNDI